MDESKLKDAGFIAFCKLVTTTLGAASTEVLYAWYFNTFNSKQKNKKDESENK
jgi:hypothetical protein